MLLLGQAYVPFQGYDACVLRVCTLMLGAPTLHSRIPISAFAIVCTAATAAAAGREVACVYDTSENLIRAVAPNACGSSLREAGHSGAQTAATARACAQELTFGTPTLLHDQHYRTNTPAGRLLYLCLRKQ